MKANRKRKANISKFARIRSGELKSKGEKMVKIGDEYASMSVLAERKNRADKHLAPVHKKRHFPSRPDISAAVPERDKPYPPLPPKPTTKGKVAINNDGVK